MNMVYDLFILSLMTETLNKYSMPKASGKNKPVKRVRLLMVEINFFSLFNNLRVVCKNKSGNNVWAPSTKIHETTIKNHEKFRDHYSKVPPQTSMEALCFTWIVLLWFLNSVWLICHTYHFKKQFTPGRWVGHVRFTPGYHSLNVSL